MAACLHSSFALLKLKYTNPPHQACPSFSLPFPAAYSSRSIILIPRVPLSVPASSTLSPLITPLTTSMLTSSVPSALINSLFPSVRSSHAAFPSSLEVLTRTSSSSISLFLTEIWFANGTPREHRNNAVGLN